MQDTPIPNEIDGRAEGRTNLFLAATMLTGGSASEVKIRDLSPIGAQIESVTFPEVGSAITLTRGRLSVPGHVSWSTERRCGLHFATRISVVEWMANSVNQEQQRVDNAIAVVKAGALPLPAPANGQAAADALAEDLTQLSCLLEMLGDALAGDPAVVSAHGITLQNLDIALQTLTVLAAIVRSVDPGGNARRLGELRVSTAQALAGQD